MSFRSPSFESTVSVSEDRSFAPDEQDQASAQPSELVGDSASTRRVRLQIDRIGPHFRTVLVQGEMGSGKELVARLLHARAGSAAGPFLCCHGAAFATDATATLNDDQQPDRFGHKDSSPW